MLAGDKGTRGGDGGTPDREIKMSMRAIIILSALIAALALPGGSMAEQTADDKAREAEMKGLIGEACFGDSYESDADMNEGNTITEKEILLLINPPRT